IPGARAGHIRYRRQYREPHLRSKTTEDRHRVVEILPYFGVDLSDGRDVAVAPREKTDRMKTKLSAVTIVDSRHSLNGQKVDMLIEDGVITSIGEVGAGGDADVVIDEEGLCVSIGWMDMRANFRDPGGEWKEDLSTGLAAAAR